MVETGALRVFPILRGIRINSSQNWRDLGWGDCDLRRWDGGFSAKKNVLRSRKRLGLFLTEKEFWREGDSRKGRGPALPNGAPLVADVRKNGLGRQLPGGERLEYRRKLYPKNQARKEFQQSSTHRTGKRGELTEQRGKTSWQTALTFTTGLECQRKRE